MEVRVVATQLAHVLVEEVLEQWGQERGLLFLDVRPARGGRGVGMFSAL